jgi:uncharacterized membrane protein (TIGR01666 family)
MNKFSQFLSKKSWYQSLRKSFLGNPDQLMAVKAVSVIGLLVIPMVILGKPFYAITLGLGALAGALSETDDHPKGRLKSMLLKVISFAISSFSVELLQPYPKLLAIGLSISTVVFILIGGFGERFRGVTFGALLIGIYTMIGSQLSPSWYIQPVLLTLGALIYGIFSYVTLIFRPWSLLEIQLAKGFSALSKYLEEKAKLFPSEEKDQKEIRAKLALLNVQTVEALDRCKEVLNSYSDSQNDENDMKPYLQYFMVLQSLHERAASSHERYDLLSNDPLNKELLGGIRQLLHELSHATQYFSECLLTGVEYKHPVSLSWGVKTLNNVLSLEGLKENHPLKLLIKNLSQSNSNLKNIMTVNEVGFVSKLERDNRTLFEKLKAQLNFNHPRMRYALRLSIAFFIGYTISEFFEIAKGEWILLTILFVLQPSYSETRRRLVQRTLGTLSGVIIGVLVIRLFTFSGQIILMLASAYLFMIWMKRRYSVAVVFITIFVLCAFNIIANKGVDVMAPRLIDTLIGAFISFFIVRFLWPEWQYKRLPGMLSEALVKNTAYFTAILKEYKQPANLDDLEYRIARREAHRSDNALVMVWRNMQLDPRKHQQLKKQAFRLTYLNHALLSYISALGAHRNQLDNSQMIDFANLIHEALHESCLFLLSENKCITHELDEIRNKLLLMNQMEEVNQHVLLFNIAEVTEQILEQAILFKNLK